MRKLWNIEEWSWRSKIIPWMKLQIGIQCPDIKGFSNKISRVAILERPIFSWKKSMIERFWDIIMRWWSTKSKFGLERKMKMMKTTFVDYNSFICTKMEKSIKESQWSNVKNNTLYKNSNLMKMTISNLFMGHNLSKSKEPLLHLIISIKQPIWTSSDLSVKTEKFMKLVKEMVECWKWELVRSKNQFVSESVWRLFMVKSKKMIWFFTHFSLRFRVRSELEE